MAVSGLIQNSGLPELSRPVQPISQHKGIVPARLYIPVLDLHANIEPVGVKADGSMGVPRDSRMVGYLSTGALPGEKGNAILDGHVDNYTGPAIFFRLRELNPGDLVIIKNKRGASVEFVVEEVKTYMTSEAPLEKIFGRTDEARLNLITCAGRYSRKKREHEARLVIFTKRLDETYGLRTRAKGNPADEAGPRKR
ncbi:class F sortase [Paenibacillus nasutitermitis]|uniref:Class F sortase n=1 Tax=Paenibacillus nasutitermitis TaxID=1652958 RepID=A0A917DWX1_9BACL|nr:class F sortase [Paenibacillus nasutitermitis]GGD75460.1 class F sortase [Paenibacillus nasutitermitis]